MTLEVRPARPEEYELVGEITAAAYAEFLEGTKWVAYLDEIADVAGRADRTEILVVADHGEIIGSATLELDGRTSAEDGPLPPHEAHIRMLGVHPDARGRGAAKALMEACEARARGAGRTFMTLNTTDLMGAAKAMYEGLGYVRGPDQPLSEGMTLLLYEKEL
jgi:ribosomal protein S18 acetylase RimI-like enzyme